MRCLDLFAGGCNGFGLAAEWMGWETVACVEIDPFCQKLLKQNFTEAEIYGDIKEFNRTEADKYRGRIELITGGFPCQDLSSAGKMEGISGSRSGLWGEMFESIRTIRPRYVLIENSPNLLVLGFERVLCDLFKIGYNAEWQCISNHSFGYPHKRERVYIVAYSNSERQESDLCQQRTFRSIFSQWSSSQADGYSMSQRIHEVPESPTIRNGNGFRHWSHRVAALGNSVNPTLAYYLMNCIKNHELAK